jgi:DNA polymerase-3 subunit epsilon
VSNDNLFEIEKPLPDWAAGPIAVFDLETTGLDHSEARIVTACAALLNPDGSLNGGDVSWLANPGIEIPAVATEVHGITTEFAREHGQDLDVVVADIAKTLKSYFDNNIPVVAYNAPYDFTILRAHLERAGLDWPEAPGPILDPLVLDKHLVQFRKGKRKLEIVAGHYNVKLEDAHNATADAIAAGRGGRPGSAYRSRRRDHGARRRVQSGAAVFPVHQSWFSVFSYQLSLALRADAHTIVVK